MSFRSLLATFAMTLLATATAFAQQPTARALVIGIKGYPRFDEHQRLKFADQDARTFYNFITSPAGGAFPMENVKLLLNEEATSSAIWSAVRSLEQSGANDMVYIFFSGHGVPDDRDFGYFMTYLGDPDNPTDGGIRADHFVEEIRSRVNVKHLVFFIDACYSGAAFGGGLAKSGNDNIAGNIIEAWQTIRSRQEEVSMAFLSARSNQRSWEDPALQHGVFTWYLMKGLAGAADSVANIGNRDGTITAEELNLYLMLNVQNHVKKLNGRTQSPTVSPNFVGSLPMRLSVHTTAESFSLAYQYVTRGYTLLQAGDSIGAGVAYSEAIRLDPSYAAAYNSLGAIVYYANVDSAAILFRKAIRHDPGHAAAHFNLGLALHSSGKLTEAISEYQEAIRLNSTWAIPHFSLGQLLEEKGDVDAAIAEYRQAVRLPQSPNHAHTYLARALLKIDDLPNAISAFREAVVKDPNRGAIEMELDSATSKWNRIQARATAARSGLTKSSENWQDLVSILHDEIHDFPGAFALLDARLREPGVTSVIYAEYVETLFTTRRFAVVDTATNVLLNSPVLEKQHAIILRALQVAALYALGKGSEAAIKLKELSNVIAAQPDSFSLGWRFSGSKYFIRTQPELEAHRQWLVQMLGALETGTRARILGQLPTPRSTAQLSWVQCDPGPQWCSLRLVDLTSAHFEGMEGVYVVWHGGANPATLRVGQGQIRGVIAALRSDGELQAYSPEGELYITWAAAAPDVRNGVEKYLIDLLIPKLGERFPYRVPIVANRPW